MVWFIIAGIAFVATIALFIKEEGIWSGVHWFFIIACAYAGLACFICFITGAILSPFAESEYINKGYFDIYSLKDNSGTYGSFYLGSGSVKSEMYYYYLGKDSDGYKIYKMDANSASIKYSDSKPKIEIYQTTDKTKWLKWVGTFCEKTKYVIYVPQNSIDMSFSIDLE